MCVRTMEDGAAPPPPRPCLLPAKAGVCAGVSGSWGCCHRSRLTEHGPRACVPVPVFVGVAQSSLSPLLLLLLLPETRDDSQPSHRAPAACQALSAGRG